MELVSLHREGLAIPNEVWDVVARLWAGDEVPQAWFRRKMQEGFDTPIREIIHGSKASAYVLMAASRLTKAIRASKGPFPVANVNDIHPTFRGLDRDHEALAFLAGKSGLKIVNEGGILCLVPAPRPEEEVLPRKESAPARANPPPGGYEAADGGRTFESVLRGLRVTVTDSLTLAWTMPPSVEAGKRTFTIRPAAVRPSTKGIGKTARSVITLLSRGMPKTADDLAEKLGSDVETVIMALDVLVQKLLVVDADPHLEANLRSHRWKAICMRILEIVPQEGFIHVGRIGQRTGRLADSREVMRALRYLEGRSLVSLSADGTRAARVVQLARNAWLPETSRRLRHGDDASNSPEKQKGRWRRDNEPGTVVVADPDILDWTCPLLGSSRDRTFVAHPVVEGSTVDAAAEVACDVLELLRDYHPRTVPRIAEVLGFGVPEISRALEFLVACGAVVDGDPAPFSRDRSLMWQRSCSALLIRYKGRAPTDPDEIVGAIPGIESKIGAESILRYLSVRGLIMDSE